MSTAGNVLVTMGAIVGVVTVGALAINFSPDLTPEMVKLLFYKGMGAAAVGLIVVGSWVARAGRSAEAPSSSARNNAITEGSQRALSEARPQLETLPATNAAEATLDADNSKSFHRDS